MMAQAPLNQEQEEGKSLQYRFDEFLKNYQAENDTQSQSENPSASQTGNLKEYLQRIANMREMDLTTLFVDFSHLTAFDPVLARMIALDFYRFEPFLRVAIREVVREFHPDFVTAETEQREFFVAFYNVGRELTVRSLKMEKVGSLVCFSGTVTRTSEVRPELLLGRFVCEDCGGTSALIEQQFKYTEPTICANPECSNRTKWKLDNSHSKFVDWQKLRVQENADEIPPGSMPRSIDVIVRHDTVDRAKAGDKVTFTGTLIVVPDVSQLYKAGQAPTIHSKGAGKRLGAASEGITGLRALGVRDMTYRTAFLAHSAAHGNPKNIGPQDDGNAEVEVATQFSQTEENEFHAMAASGTVYRDLVASLSPTIHGHVEIKKGLILMLMGGVHKKTPEGIRLRGDINVCIVGDPSTAKSQFLKYAVKFSPRAVFTSGKASSAAGLTASIVKDPDTGEHTIEAGALMLADNGVCCIDEFDKMDPADQVAIHEAMEQQTISVTKAGIQATLNARTSILAAANPIFGRYDKTKTLRQNVAISAPIMSRFDLFFIVLDEANDREDEAIASHIVAVHQQRGVTEEVVYPMEKIQNYVRYARTFNPQLTAEAKRAIIKCYLHLRQQDNLNAAGSAYKVTVRQLESMVRLSEALARLHLDDKISARYVLEAYTLISRSMLRIDHSDVPLDDDDFAAVAMVESLLEGSESLPGTPGSVSRKRGRSSPVKTPSPSTKLKKPRAGETGDPVPPPADAAAGHPRKKLALSYAEYNRMKVAFALRLRRQEKIDADALGTEGTEKTDAERALEGAMRVRELVDFFLETQQDISGQDELKLLRRTAKKVIHRLIEMDQVLYYVQGATQVAGDDDDEKWVRLSEGFTLEGLDA